MKFKLSRTSEDIREQDLQLYKGSYFNENNDVEIEINTLEELMELIKSQSDECFGYSRFVIECDNANRNDESWELEDYDYYRE